MFNIPQGKTFWDAFNDLAKEFHESTKHLSHDEFLSLTNKPEKKTVDDDNTGENTTKVTEEVKNVLENGGDKLATIDNEKMTDENLADEKVNEENSSPNT